MVQSFLFLAGGRRCAIPLAGIRSVIQMMAIDPVAPAPRGMAGTINLHGRIMPAYSVRELLGLPGRSPRISDMLLIAEAGSDMAALWIDETCGVEELVLPPDAETDEGRNTDTSPDIVITDTGIVFIGNLVGFLAQPPDAAILEAIRALGTGEEPSPESEQKGMDNNQVQVTLAERAAKMLPSEPGSVSSDMTEVLRFQLAYRQYAIEMKYVREVILTGEITPVPGTPDFITGICASRGQIISLVDLRALLKIPEQGLTDLNRVVVITDQKITFGILADTISGVGTISLDQIIPPHSEDIPGSHRYLKGVHGRDLLVLDGAAILGDPDIIVDDA